MSSYNISDCYKCFPGGLNGRSPIIDDGHLCARHLHMTVLELMRKIVCYQELDLSDRGIIE